MPGLIDTYERFEQALHLATKSCDQAGLPPWLTDLRLELFLIRSELNAIVLMLSGNPESLEQFYRHRAEEAERNLEHVQVRNGQMRLEDITPP